LISFYLKCIDEPNVIQLSKPLLPFLANIYIVWVKIKKSEKIIQNTKVAPSQAACEPLLATEAPLEAASACMQAAKCSSQAEMWPP
jgi:hypothetical protein